MNCEFGRLALLLLAALTLHPAIADAASDARAAVVRALPILQRSAATFVDKRSCVSCHHNILPIVALRLADTRGVAVDAAVLTHLEAKTFRELTADNAIDDAIQTAGLSDPTPNDSLVLMAAHTAGYPRDLAAAVYARRLSRWQRPDGRWVTSDFRPPHSSSQFTATATAILALRSYMPEELSVERDANVQRALAWLHASWPRSTEDAAFRLLGLVWGGADRERVESASRVLESMQLPTGGWPQLPSYGADAYSTGEALYALSVAGVPTSSPDWTRGERFLLTTQAPDGTWRVRTRMLSPAEISPPYFHTGFPYAKDEFLSYAGSCWAVMALLSSLPEAPTHLTPSAPSSSKTTAPTWLRTALFGTVGDLTTLLDAGLDPNSATTRGTTPLMAAALDRDKTRLLLARGANPRTRGRAGIDAVTIAASHVGTTGSVTALLEAGAEAQPPADVHPSRTPLVGAALAGDLDVVNALVRHGATPSAQAVSEAVTFGHALVVKALIDAGGNAGGVDRTGVNLLHWAAITNRPTVVRILFDAGVPIDAVDDHGFTPLMYAATVDHGDTAMIEALRGAGADVRVRNGEGRTALQQARHFKHAEAARILK